MAELAATGVGAQSVVSWIAGSLGVVPVGGRGDEILTLSEIAEVFDVHAIDRSPCRLPPFAVALPDA